MKQAWQRWCTSDHGARAFEFWHDAVCAGVVESEFDADLRADFSGTMLSQTRAEARLVHFSSSAHRIRRSHAQAQRQGADRVMLSLQTRGRALMSQGGGHAVLEPGDFGLLDAGSAFDIDFPESTARRLILLPRHVLGTRAPQFRRLRGPVRIPAQAPLSPLLAEAVRLLTDADTELQERTVGALLGTVVELLGAQLGEREAPAAPTELSFANVLRHTDTHLGDPALSPAAVAAACRISVRTLHRLFARHAKLSFEAYVVQARLALAHEALISGRAVSVSDAAFAAGFNNLSHFARRFSERYGEPPVQLLKRQAARGD